MDWTIISAKAPGSISVTYNQASKVVDTVSLRKRVRLIIAKCWCDRNQCAQNKSLAKHFIILYVHFRQVMKITIKELLAHSTSTFSQQHIEWTNCVNKFNENSALMTVMLPTTNQWKKWQKLKVVIYEL